MKKLMLLLLLISLSTVSVAQTINVHKKNGETIKYNSSDVDFLDFSESGQQTSSDNYSISGGVRVNYGKKIYSLFNCLAGEKYDVTYDSYGRLSRIDASGPDSVNFEFDYNQMAIICNRYYYYLSYIDSLSFEVNADGCISKLVRSLVDSENNVIGYYGYEYEYSDGFLTKVIPFNNTGVEEIRIPELHTDYMPDSFIYNGENLLKMSHRHNSRDYVIRYTTDSILNKGNFYAPSNWWSQQITFMSAMKFFGKAQSSETCHYCLDAIFFNSGLFGKVSKNMVTSFTRTELWSGGRTYSSDYVYSYDHEGYVNCLYCKGSTTSDVYMDLDITYK